MARPTNNVLVMVGEASGCWAKELKAVDTALPSASAGPMVPKPVVIPAMIIDTIAIVAILSIKILSIGNIHFAILASPAGLGFRTRMAAAM